MTEEMWMEARCRPEYGSDPELWFPVALEGTSLGDSERAEAKAVCATCPLIGACLEYAIETGQEYGVWGGATEGERAAMIRHRTRLVLGVGTPH
jgi:WhiB family transcriptional regulator, redox-sensing transcriptional regulator